MQPEQQQRIMGYFIEEAKDHLNTIEQGLLNLQSTIEDQEMVNELFRAAHSVKGGAAMLGLNSIQQVSHRLEDYFKILKESPVKVDQKLESLFLQVFDALQELVGQLQGPFGLTDETAKATVAGVEHVFGELENHLNVLANSAPLARPAGNHPAGVGASSTPSPAQQDSAFILLFQNDIPLRLREMLQLFKQSELDTANRQQLQDLCRQLIAIGERFGLPDWCNLIDKAQAAIAYAENSYRTLAPIVIRDIKQAQEQVLSGHAADITPCAQLQALQPPTLLAETAEDDFAALLAADDGANWLTEPQSAMTDEALFAGLDTTEPAIALNDSDTAPMEAEAADQHGPEVGVAELNSLADLFEGEMPDLGSTWQEEEILADAAATSAFSSIDAATFDESTDFSDLLFGDAEIGQEEASTSSQDALTDLFSDDSLAAEPLLGEGDRPPSGGNPGQNDLNDLFGGSDAADLSASMDWSAPIGAEVKRDAATVDFDDVFGELNLDADADAEHMAFAPEPTSAPDSPLDNLGELFAGMEGEQDLSLLELQSERQAEPLNSSQRLPVELNLEELDDPFGIELENQSVASPTSSASSTASIADPWDELNQLSTTQPPAATQSAPFSTDAAIAPPQADQDGSDADAFFGDDPLPEFIEELSDQDDLDFSSLLQATAQTPTNSFAEPLLEESLLEESLLEESLLEELSDDALARSIASLLADDAAPPADVALSALDQPLSADAPLTPPTTMFQSDLSDPWSIPEPPLPSTEEAADAASLNLDLSDLDFGNDARMSEPSPDLADSLDIDFTDFDTNDARMSEPSPDLADSLDIDFTGFDTNDALETNLLDASASWLVVDPSEEPIDPVASLEEPFANEPPPTELGALTDADLLNDSLETLPDFDAFFAASSESLPNAFDDLVDQSSSAADAFGGFFDEPAHANENLELPEDLLTIGVPLESRSGGVEAEALSDDLLGLSALDSIDEPAIAPLAESLDLSGPLFVLDEPVPANESDTEASGEQGFGEQAVDEWGTSTDTDDIATLSLLTETITGEDGFDVADDSLGFNALESAVAPLAPPAEDSLDFGDDLDFGDELFTSPASERMDASEFPSTAERLDFDDALFDFDNLSERNSVAVDGADSDAFSLEFDRSAFDALGFDSPSADTPVSPDLRSDENADSDFSLAFDQPDALDQAAFDALESDSSLDASAATLESDFGESDFDWEGASTEDEASENESGDDLLDLNSLLSESSVPAVNNDFEAFDDLLDEGSSFDDLLDEGSSPDVNDALAFDNLLGEETDDEFADLSSFLSANSATNDESDLESFLDQGAPATDDLTDLDTLLAEASETDSTDTEMNVLDIAAAGGMLAFVATGALQLGDFSDLESLLQGEPLELADTTLPSDTATTRASEFDDLDDLLKDAEEKMGGSPTVKVARNSSAQNRRPTRPGKIFSEQTMRVPVKHLDNLSNLVGELVVNRNSLEEDQERLRQSLDNLLYQVQQLSDVGQRMQDLYERSLLESSLLASRQSHRSAFGAPASARESGVFAQTANATGIEYDPLEMDRFTGFHSLSQEMIELIVRVRESSSDIEFIVDETDQVTRMFRQVTTQLQEGLTRSRMVPFAQTADRLPRAVRDIAMKVGKQAELSVEGRETLIDKMILEQLYDPMTHLVNNAITHGIESPEVRRAAGKPPAGRITIRAFHQGNQTIISVSDDGAGIDIDRVKVKAIEKGLITAAEAQHMTQLDIYDLLFHAGFSTKDQADDFSGRGVGMDVVRTSLSEIRGAINTDSTYGKGTTFTIRLPLTLSISKALCCISDRARIAFPMDGVEDMLDVPKERIQTNAEGQACIPWRDSLLPLRPLNELLAYSRHLSRGNVYGGNQEDDIVSIVVLRSAGNFLALQVDQVLGEQEIVIKQLEGPIPKPVGVAGATVLGDGRIMPIADVLELIDLSMGRIRKDVGGSLWEQDGVSMIQEAPIAKTEPTVLIVDDSITVRELLSMTFNKVGYRVEQARDGQEAWEKLRAGLPCDIVFCDIEMPRMDGLELLSRIQKDPNLSHLPIAMLTSRGADRHRQMAVSLGASGYFTKPYLEEALLDAAQRMLKGEVLISNSNA